MDKLDWENIASKYSYALSKEDILHLLKDAPSKECGSVYFVDVDGVTKNYTCAEWDLHERPPKEETKPVYTQERFDSGEGVKVNMHCMIKLNRNTPPEKCKILGFFEEREVWIFLYDGLCTAVLKIFDGMFQPLETKTPADKLKDRIFDSFDGYDEFLMTEQINIVRTAIEHAVDYINTMDPHDYKE